MLKSSKKKGMNNALNSLYGKGHADAGSGRRNQTILTPPCIIERVLKVWPEGIALDPCAEPPKDGAKPFNIPADIHCTSAQPFATDGLKEPWPERTFVNPPYSNLKPWMEKAATEFEVMLLAPVRTHRKWFKLSDFNLACLLDPIKFVGFQQAYPAPLCILYSGDRFSEFKKAFSDIGRCSFVAEM